MSVKIDISPTKIQVKIDNVWKNGLEQLSTEILADCNEYCKEDTGTLIMSSYVHSELDKGKLIWQTPYAKRQYYEIRTAHKQPNPNASWKWCEVAKIHHKERWAKLAQRIVREAK